MRVAREQVAAALHEVADAHKEPVAARGAALEETVKRVPAEKEFFESAVGGGCDCVCGGVLAVEVWRKWWGGEGGGVVWLGCVGVVALGRCCRVVVYGGRGACGMKLMRAERGVIAFVEVKAVDDVECVAGARWCSSTSSKRIRARLAVEARLRVAYSWPLLNAGGGR